MPYIKLYHHIWHLSLSPNAFRTYCSILRFMNADTNYANVSMRKIAASVGISEKSVSRGIRELQEKKLLTVIEKYYNGHRLANGYLISPQSGRYTKLPVSALAAPVSASGFIMYAYISKCADAHKRAFPSLRNISETIGITIQTVITQIKELVSCKLLNKFHQIKKDSSFGHNLYHIFDSAITDIKNEKTRLARVSSQIGNLPKSKCKISVRLKAAFVKCSSAISSFLKRGTQILSAHVLNPLFNILERKRSFIQRL